MLGMSSRVPTPSFLILPASGSRRETAMPKRKFPELIYCCPHTDRPLETGIGTDSDSLRQSWSDQIRFKCRHCGMEHNVMVRDAYVEFTVRTVSVDRGIKHF